MTVRDALNRGYNLVGTAIIAISGLAFFPEFFTEDELTHRLDEGVLLLLAISSIVWYLIGKKQVFSHHCSYSLYYRCPGHETHCFHLVGERRCSRSR